MIGSGAAAAVGERWWLRGLPLVIAIGVSALVGAGFLVGFGVGWVVFG